MKSILYLCFTGIVLAQPPVQRMVTIPNASSTGTTVHKLAKLTGAPSKAVVSGAGDTGGVIGIVNSGAGTTGSATIQEGGQTTCVFDGATTAGHYVQISASVAGDCTDAGATLPTSGQVIGQVMTSNGGGGTYTVDMANRGGGGGGSPAGPNGSVQYDNSGAFGAFGNWDTQMFSVGGSIGSQILLDPQFQMGSGGAWASTGAGFVITTGHAVYTGGVELNPGYCGTTAVYCAEISQGVVPPPLSEGLAYSQVIHTASATGLTSDTLCFVEGTFSAGQNQYFPCTAGDHVVRFVANGQGYATVDVSNNTGSPVIDITSVTLFPDDRFGIDSAGNVAGANYQFTDSYTGDLGIYGQEVAPFALSLNTFNWTPTAGTGYESSVAQTQQRFIISGDQTIYGVLGNETSVIVNGSVSQIDDTYLQQTAYNHFLWNSTGTAAGLYVLQNLAEVDQGTVGYVVVQSNQVKSNGSTNRSFNTLNSSPVGSSLPVTHYQTYNNPMTGVTNGVFEFDADVGVLARQEDTAYNGTSQSIQCLYNNKFTSFTSGATNFEGGCVGAWDASNGFHIYTKNGGTGVLRNIFIDGAEVDLGTVSHLVNIPASTFKFAGVTCALTTVATITGVMRCQ